jgi:Ca2+-binding RTX toxin-like protein
MLIRARSKAGDGIQYILRDADDIIVKSGVTIRSYDYNGIKGAGAGQQITVAGTIVAFVDGIAVTGNGTDVVVQAGGKVVGDHYGVKLGGGSSTLTNDGTIRGGYGIFVDHSGAGLAEITNRGTIIGENYGIQIDDQSVFLRNRGTISTDTGGYAFGGSDRNDRVINSGLMIGSVGLEDGNDLYDGRKGTVTGPILGGDGNDRFQPGAGVEVVGGGAGTDTLDFCAGGAVSVNLVTPAQNTGAARGDQYVDIERIYGSVRGNDRLIGDGAGNVLQGFGGADTLVAGDGQDVLVGGKGRDVVDVSQPATFFTDYIDFYAPDEGGDRISGFSVEDVIAVRAAAFRGGLAPGVLDSGRFHSGGTNRAGDAGDRFIFRTGDATLWFDRDGNRSGFAPVLLADFTDRTSFQFGNIAVF